MSEFDRHPGLLDNSKVPHAKNAHKTSDLFGEVSDGAFDSSKYGAQQQAIENIQGKAGPCSQSDVND